VQVREHRTRRVDARDLYTGLRDRDRDAAVADAVLEDRAMRFCERTIVRDVITTSRVGLSVVSRIFEVRRCAGFELAIWATFGSRAASQ